jgi:hypothetical protein
MQKSSGGRHHHQWVRDTGEAMLLNVCLAKTKVAKFYFGANGQAVCIWLSKYKYRSSTRYYFKLESMLLAS